MVSCEVRKQVMPFVCLFALFINMFIDLLVSLFIYLFICKGERERERHFYTSCDNNDTGIYSHRELEASHE